MLADTLIISLRTYFLTWLFVVCLLHKMFSTAVEQPCVLIAFLISEQLACSNKLINLQQYVGICLSRAVIQPPY